MSYTLITDKYNYMNTDANFVFERYYHIYNRTNNKEKLFLSDDNRKFFLKRYKHYLSPYLHIHAFALMGNHFHFSVKIKTHEEIDNYLINLPKKEKTLTIKRFIASDDKESYINTLIIGQHHRFLISYAQAFNRMYKRDGNLFHKKFKRSLFLPELKLKKIIFYIHHNARKHGIVKNFKDYKWTSYHDIVNAESWIVDVDYIIDYFGGLSNFQRYHEAETET